MAALVLLTAASLVMVPNAAFAAPGPSEDKSEDVDSILAPTVNDALFETSRQLEEAGVLGARSELATLIADSKIADDGAWELLYHAGDARASTVVDLVDKVSETAPMEIRAVPIETDPIKLNALAERVSLGSEGDLKQLGVSKVSGAQADTERGVLVVYLPGESAPTTESPVVDGFPVEFVSNINVQAQSRDWDWAPWTGGAQLRNTSTLGSLDCTAGFNWSRWADGERMGSTAEHCYRPTTESWRYNHGNPVGQRYYYSNARDVFLMRSYGAANQFSANVFVGGNATNTIRTVVGNVASPPVNGAVALSGGRTGLHAAKILSNGYYNNGMGPMTITDGTFCRGGDSGGPWLATNTAGDVIAYGQHHGAFTDYTGTIYYNCLFVPVTPISSTMQATIMTG